jgi:predicted DNA-binding transcriptional regulator AlpA
MHIVSIDPAPELLTRRQAAAVLGLAETTLRRWYAENRGPRVVKIGTARAGRVRYCRSDLLAWANDPVGYAVQTRPENLPRFTPPSRGNPRRRKVST